jgi:pimeloyl-ACP methyl ester carboxylesterase
VIADLIATPKEIVVGPFRAHSEYDPLPALRQYGRPTLAVATPVSDAPFGPHNLGADLPHAASTGIGHWLRMDKPEESDRILDEFLARVRATGALRSREAGK